MKNVYVPKANITIIPTVRRHPLASVRLPVPDDERSCSVGRYVRSVSAY